MNASTRREALRTKLIELAHDQIAAEGAASVKARPLAAAAGCSVGAIYNVFGDLGDLILAVNARTFVELQAQVEAAVEVGDAPIDQMMHMAETYLAFARAQPRLWSSLFETNMAREGEGPPDWYLAALDRVLALIDAPLGQLYPELPKDEIRLRTQTLFSAIHGIVLLGIEGRASAVSEDRLREMIRYLLVSVATSRHFVNGVQK